MVEYEYEDEYEDELEVIFSEINKKMEAAADLIREASNLAKENKMNLCDLHYEYKVNRDLFSAMYEAGWEVSSLKC